MNVQPHNSLFNDMKDAINNIDRDELIDDDRDQNQISNDIDFEKVQPEKTFTYSRKQLKESAEKISNYITQNNDRIKEKEELKI